VTGKKVWLITGAGRGLGVDIAKAVLAAGQSVVATGRDAAKVAAAVGVHDNLLTIKLDVTRPQDAKAAVEAAVAKFGRLDVLVNNAGNFFAGFFEELSPEQVRNQIETLLFGPMNVTRAVLPVMRKQRSGLLLTISSTAGIAGQMFCTAYAAAKFGVEGWMESLTPEVAPFGIRTMLVEPGFFRTELLTNDSTTYAQPTIATTPSKPRRSSLPGRAWMGSKVATPPSSPTPS
jgi:NAD(P)-dependent dehydrogenase (short-subunit alcohol dehydrogenase family)